MHGFAWSPGAAFWLRPPGSRGSNARRGISHKSLDLSPSSRPDGERRCEGRRDLAAKSEKLLVRAKAKAPAIAKARARPSLGIGAM